MNPSTVVYSLPVATISISSAIEHRFFRSIESASADWQLAAPADDLFLQVPYLRLLENNPPEGFRFGYLVFYKMGQPVGVALCQILFFKLEDHLQHIDKPSKEVCFFSTFAVCFKKWVAGRMAADLLICGNLLNTGAHGWYFDPQVVSRVAAAKLLESGLSDIQAQLQKEGSRVSISLVKDVAPEDYNTRDWLKSRQFSEFKIQPNMVLELPFATFDAYLAAMSTKYRTRAKRAFKKASGLVHRELSLAEIERESPIIDGLYKQVAGNAGFNMVDLNKGYLAALKRGLPERFRLIACYLDGRMVAFYTLLDNYGQTEAHYLGYEKSANHDLQLYLNILYELVRLAIESGSKRIVFARTALEIKSSVGAVPKELYCFVHHQHPVLNRFSVALLAYLKPPDTWVQRHPFKEE